MKKDLLNKYGFEAIYCHFDLNALRINLWNASGKAENQQTNKLKANRTESIYLIKVFWCFLWMCLWVETVEQNIYNDLTWIYGFLKWRTDSIDISNSIGKNKTNELFFFLLCSVFSVKSIEHNKRNTFEVNILFVVYFGFVHSMCSVCAPFFTFCSTIDKCYQSILFYICIPNMQSRKKEREIKWEITKAEKQILERVFILYSCFWRARNILLTKNW